MGQRKCMRKPKRLWRLVQDLELGWENMGTNTVLVKGEKGKQRYIRADTDCVLWIPSCPGKQQAALPRFILNSSIPF
jgi:hypothetical protein